MLPFSSAADIALLIGVIRPNRSARVDLGRYATRSDL
jgi:hypothetical protein